MLAVSSLFVRRIYKLLHLVPVILLSLAGAWTVSTMVFDRLHILVFVIGSLLSGVAIDYGFYIYMQPSLRPDETYCRETSPAAEAAAGELPHDRHWVFAAFIFRTPVDPTDWILRFRGAVVRVDRGDALFCAA